MLTYMTIIVITMLVGLVGTILVGVSQKNKMGNPAYDRKLIGNWGRLGIYYVLMTIVFIGLLIYLLRI